MGKDSLIKSTSKKATGTKKEEEKQTTKKADAKTKAKKKTTAAKKVTTKKAAAKKTTTKKAPAKTTKKSAPKTAKKAASKAAKKPAAKKAAKSAPAAKAKAVPKKKPSPKPAKKPTPKELVFKKFEPIGPVVPVASAPKRPATATEAPPFFSTDDPEEAKRLRALLLNKFSMAEIKAAAKAPEPVPEPKVEETAIESQRAQQAQPTPEQPAPVEPPVAEGAYITVEPPEEKATSDPMTRAAKMAAAVIAVVVFLMLSISYNNSSKYYILPKENAIEIWKGRFSPKDTMFYMVLHGVELAEPPAEVYTSKEVFPLIFNYYLDKADTLLEVPGLPDFDGIKGYLHNAQDYVVNADMKSAVLSRLNNIERMILLYKADVAISKGTVDSLQSGIKLLKEADVIAASEIQSQEIAQKIEAARIRIQEIEAASE